MIIFDSTYLVVFLNQSPPPAKDRDDNPVEKFKERVQFLAANFDSSNEPIGIPAPHGRSACPRGTRKIEVCLYS